MLYYDCLLKLILFSHQNRSNFRKRCQRSGKISKNESWIWQTWNETKCRGCFTRSWTWTTTCIAPTIGNNFFQNSWRRIEPRRGRNRWIKKARIYFILSVLVKICKPTSNADSANLGVIGNDFWLATIKGFFQLILNLLRSF